MRKTLAQILLVLMLGSPVTAAVLSSTPDFDSASSGDAITVAGYNGAIRDLYTWINANIVATLNLLTAKGDLYGYSGSALAARTVGSNNQVLVGASAQTMGINWATYTGESPMTTKGDLLVRDDDSIERLAVGSNDQVLTADSTETLGMSWETPVTSSPFPVGAIVSWSPAKAGTDTIPTGWVLCDGNNSTPNLIGRFVLGTRPNGSSASPSAGGYGAIMVDGNANGTTVHGALHCPTFNFTSGDPDATTSIQSGTGATVGAASHTHEILSGGASPFGNVTSTEPADYTLVYIMKT